jgi:2-polyprenyl-6-methoxyphenol hydroxylase-like FAD-dependent oxidoreductase
MPRLRALIGDVEIDGVKIRPVDLYVSKGYRQPGIVLVGDAFGTSCPAAGTGCNKVFTDVVRLCKTHIPRWMATAGMESDKIVPSTTTRSRSRARVSAPTRPTTSVHFAPTMGSRGARDALQSSLRTSARALRQRGERLLTKPAAHHGAPARSGAG